MSNHNSSISYYNTSFSITDKITLACIREKVVLVYLLLEREIKRKGWYLNTIPFYPKVMNLYPQQDET